MAAASDYLEAKVLDHVLNATAYTSPTTVYLALFTDGALLEAGTLTDEITGKADYARQAISFGAASQTSNVMSSKNDADITFDSAGEDWGTITHVAVMDAATGGNVLFHGEAAAAKLIEEDDIFQVTTGNFAVTLA